MVIQYTTENNKVMVAGRIESPLTFGHEIYGEAFYNFILAVPRLSEYIDFLPVTISERLLDSTGLSVGTEIVINGELRSYNKYIEGKNRLILTIFTKDIYLKKEEIRNPNQIYLDGYICKPPVYRTTPFQREIADILLAVNRSYNKSDYIPVITWGRNARFSQHCPLVNVSESGAGFRAGRTRKSCQTVRLLIEWLTKYRFQKWK